MIQVRGRVFFCWCRGWTAIDDVEAMLTGVCALLKNFRSVASGRRLGELYASRSEM
jgi:hypothetical protein